MKRFEQDDTINEFFNISTNLEPTSVLIFKNDIIWMEFKEFIKGIYFVSYCHWREREYICNTENINYIAMFCNSV